MKSKQTDKKYRYIRQPYYQHIYASVTNNSQQRHYVLWLFVRLLTPIFHCDLLNSWNLPQILIDVNRHCWKGFHSPRSKVIYVQMCEYYNGDGIHLGGVRIISFVIHQKYELCYARCFSQQTWASRSTQFEMYLTTTPCKTIHHCTLTSHTNSYLLII